MTSRRERTASYWDDYRDDERMAESDGERSYRFDLERRGVLVELGEEIGFGMVER